MKRAHFLALLALLTPALCGLALACGDIENSGGSACDPAEEPPDGFECVCDDPDPELASCTLESLDGTNNGANNGIAGDTTIRIFDAQWTRNDARAATLTIETGTTITWRNDEPSQRNVTCEGLPEATGDSGALEEGETFAITFTSTGTHRCYDRINTNFADLETIITVE